MTEMGAAPAPTERGEALLKSAFAEMPMDKAYVGRATPRGTGAGWEVRVFVMDPESPGQQRLVGLTECGTLNQLEDKTWDFVRALTDDTDVRVLAVPEIGDDVMTRVIGAWKAMKDAKAAEAEAAKRTREVVKELRDRGLSVTDIAWLAHISRGRVSQLLI